MIIVIEGANCTGKTTVCAELARRLNTESIHFPTKNGDVGVNSYYGELFRKTGKQKYARLDFKENERLLEGKVVDRMWHSNYVYSKLAGEEAKLVASHGHYTFTLYASDDLLKERLFARVKDCDYTERNKEKILQQLSEANKLFQQIALRKICVDEKTVDEIVCEIMKEL